MGKGLSGKDNGRPGAHRNYPSRVTRVTQTGKE